MPITYGAETHELKGHLELVVPIRKFSKMTDSVPHNIDIRECIKYDPLSRSFAQSSFRVWQMEVYTNGYDSTTKGYVCVDFADFRIPDMDAIQTYVISVVDSEGTRRFPQSFSRRQELIENDPDPECDPYLEYYGITRYISRRVLLNEPSELIPGDTLSLHIDLDICSEPKVVKPYYIKSIESCIELGPDRKTWVLPLDSKLGRRLCEESKYFECLRTTSLMEGDSRNKIFPIEENGILGTKEHKELSTEFLDFDTIHSIFSCTVVKLYQIYDIFRLYMTADKYYIPLVVDFCRNCLELSFTTETAPEILEFAEEFRDDHLRETAEKFHAADCRLPVENTFTVHSRATGMD